MEKINCLFCDHALKRVYSDGGVDIICKIDQRPMRDYLQRLAECSGFQDKGITKEVNAKEKGRRP
jgi:hypothetical protein